MGIGVSILLIAVGAILAFAVNATTSGIDIQMPLLDGVAAAERILASWPEARVVIYSGDETELARGRTAGVRAALQKGKLVDALVAAVEGAAAR